MSRYSFITAYIADPEPKARPQASPSAAAAANRGPQSADIPSDQQGHRGGAAYSAEYKPPSEPSDGRIWGRAADAAPAD